MFNLVIPADSPKSDHFRVRPSEPIGPKAELGARCTGKFTSICFRNMAENGPPSRLALYTRASSGRYRQERFKQLAAAGLV